MRKFRHVTDPSAPEWPAGVKTIEGVALLGIHQSTGELYWDGQALVTEKRLANFERGMALVVTIATVVLACIEIGRAAGWIAH